MALILYVTQMTQRIGTKNAVLTWNTYQPTNGDPLIAEDICQAFLTHVLPPLLDAQGDYVDCVSCYTYNATTAESSYYTQVTGSGQRTSTPGQIPGYFTTATVRWRVNPNQDGPRPLKIKNGYSRIGGLLDDDIVQGSLNPTWIANYGDPFADAFRQTRTIGGQPYYVGIHVPPKTDPPTPWQLAGILDDRGWKIGTQNTRKQG